MTPIAGLNDPAEAEGLAIPGVTGPIGQGSRGGVPIVKVNPGAGAGGGGCGAIAAGGSAGAHGGAAATGPTGASAGAATGAAGLLCAFNCASRRRIRAS